MATTSTRTLDEGVHEGLLKILFHLRGTDAHPAGEMRSRILSTAIPMFAGRGYAGTSMRDIAAGVGIKAASLYAHFPDGKEQLLREGLQEIFDEFLAHVVAELSPDASPEEQLRSVVHQHVHWQLESGAKAPAWDAALDQFGIEGVLPKDYAIDLRARQHLYHAYMTSLVRAIRQDDTAQVRALAILALCNSANVFHASGEGPKASVDDVADTVWMLAQDLAHPA